MATMAGSEPRQRAFLASHSAPTSHPSPDGDGVTKTEKTKRSGGGEKTRTLHTNQKNGHLAEFMHERVRTVRWSRELFARAVTVGNRREVEQNGGRGQLANKAKPQRQRLTAAKWHTAVFQRKTKLKPNRTKPKRCETKRNATKTNMFFN